MEFKRLLKDQHQITCTICGDIYPAILVFYCEQCDNMVCTICNTEEQHEQCTH